MNSPSHSPHDRAEEIFNGAASLEPAARAAFLDQACDGDPSLRARVDELLRAAADIGSRFLPEEPRLPGRPGELPTLLIQAGERQGERPGDWVGRYKLLEKLGEGGCGVVYLAQQEEPVRRRVALKIIKLGMDTRQVVARFEAERQALALMDHPNIAKVLDGGTTDTGRPYFVMELVRGVRITEYCDEAQLTPHQRLELFAQVCQAVQHAHQKGIIHRDLKPSNILVTINDGEAVPKVIDFGIAKATSGQELTDKSVYTAFEQFIGTPAYMSPEQALMTSLDIDTRSDVYSLGVLLYELLTGRPPFDPRTLMAAGLDEMRRTIREDEPMRPSTVAARELSTYGSGDGDSPSASASSPSGAGVQGGRNRTRRQIRLQEALPLLRGDLDWIVMKCLEKDRRRRYDTAAGLAADIRRHLGNEPVLARPPSLGYRVQKTLRRHRSAFATAGIVVVAVLTGLGVAVQQAVRKTQALAAMTQAEHAQARLREVAEKALIQEAEARQHVGELLEREKAELQQAERRIYATDIHLANQAVEKGNFEGAREFLARHYPRPGQTHRPGWEWRHLWQQLQDDASFEVHRVAASAEFSRAPTDAGYFSPDGRWFATRHQTADRAWIELVDMTDPRAPRRAVEIAMPSTNRILAFAFAPRGGLIAHAQSSVSGTQTSFEAGSTIRIQEVATRRSVGTITNRFIPGILQMAWSGDGQTLFCMGSVPGESPNKLQPCLDVWRVSDLTLVTTLTNGLARHQPATIASHFAVSADGGTVAVAGYLHPLSVIDVGTGAIRWSLSSKHRGFVQAIVAPDGHTLFALEEADPWVIRAFDLLTGRELSPPLESGDGGVLGRMALAPDGRTLAAFSSRGYLRAWDVGDLSQGAMALPPLRWRHGTPKGITFMPDARTVLTLSSEGSVLAWDIARDPQPRQPLRAPFGTDVREWHLAADNRTILTATADGAVSQRHGTTFQSETKLFTLAQKLVSGHFSKDGRWFAAGSTNGRVEVWNVPERRRILEFGSHPGRVDPLRFSPDGGTLMVLDSENERVTEWDLAASRELRSFPAFNLEELPRWRGILSADGRQSLTASKAGEITWLDTHSLEKKIGNLGLPKVTEIRFSPDAGLFAASSADGYARVYSAQTLEPTATLGDRRGQLNTVQFLEEGHRLILGGRHLSGEKSVGFVAIWDVATRLELVRLAVKDGVADVNFSEDGNVLIATGSLARYQPPEPLHYALYFWAAPSWEEIERAEATRPNVTSTGGR